MGVTDHPNILYKIFLMFGRSVDVADSIHNTTVDSSSSRGLFQFIENEFSIGIKMDQGGWSTLEDAISYLLPVRKELILFDSSFLLIVMSSSMCHQHLKEVCVFYSVERFLVINGTCIDVLLVLDATFTDHSEEKYVVSCSSIGNEAKLHVWDF